MEKIIITFLSILLTFDASADNLTLWSKKPAGLKAWKSSYPLGNGKLGGLVFGGIDKDIMIMNEDSLWSGWAEPDQAREGAYETLGEMRKILKEQGDKKEVNRLALMEFISLKHADFGAYQSFCNAEFQFDHDPAAVTNYKRDLDLKTAVASVNYSLKGVDYKREYICSYPDKVLAMNLTASKGAQISFTLGASSSHKGSSITADGNKLTLDGQIDTKNTDHPGMKFQGIWEIRANGGTVTNNKSGTQLIVTGADSVTIIMSGATNHKLEYPTYIGEDPSKQNLATLEKVKEKSYQGIREAHLADYQKIFNRVKFELKGKSHDEMTTVERIANYKKKKDDLGFESLIFQYGRYLTIATSRKGTLPSNLQGIWNNSNRPMWNCDYHFDTNIQMNYLPVDLCNMSECAEPLMTYIKDLKLSGEKTAKDYYHSKGWIVHVTSNVWGKTAPAASKPQATLKKFIGLNKLFFIDAGGSAAICLNVWDHYAFTGNKEFLKNTAWPLMKGAAEFWVDNLQENNAGELVVSPSWSPEHGMVSDGGTYHPMLVWDLFTNCIQAAKILDTDKEFAAKLSTLRDRILPLKIGKYGQLQEWNDPKLEEGVKKDQHRHLSHLFAVYPGKQIIAGRDEELTAAAKQSVTYRGLSGSTPWSNAWKIGTWARMLEGDKARKHLQIIFSKKILPNLWTGSGVFQIEANFGITAGVAEMLVQSHTDEIILLPALPTAWSEGSMKGLCARGGFVLDNIEWANSELVSVTVRSRTGTNCTLNYKGTKKSLIMKAGETITLTGQELKNKKP